MRILLVDDDPSVLRAVRSFIAREGHHVDAFDSPAPALAAVCANPHFDGALLDVDIDGSDGVELAAALKGICPALRVAFATGSGASAARASAHGMVLLKPCPVAELRALLASWAGG